MTSNLSLQQKKLSADTQQAEPVETLIFEKSRPGAQAVTVPAYGKATTLSIPSSLKRQQTARLPEVSQLDVMRHFVKLSHLNHCIDSGFYPLGSCTMKFNPKVCDQNAALVGFSQLHPQMPAHLSQGTLEVIYRLQECLKAITGFDAVSLQPAAGAHGELVGMMMIQAYFRKTGQTHKTEVIVPDSAHGTNPSSAAICGFEVREIRTNPETGLVDLEGLKAAVSEKTAGLMLTNPSTAGLFEKDILEICDIVHKAGGLMYYDGANLNAVLGKARPADMGFDVMHINTHKTFATPHGAGGPGCGPVAVTSKLEPFLPKPVVELQNGTYQFNWDRPDSIGKVKAFWGNVEMMVRAYTYLMAYGLDGLRQVTEDAVLNANYLKEHLKSTYHLPFDTVCKHEFVFSSKYQHDLDKRINTMTIAKRLMDYGIHPPTVYFPLIIHEALMIEPTDTESKETLDHFIAVMKQIAEECKSDPEMVINAPHTTPIGRVDEVTAARKPNLNYFAA